MKKLTKIIAIALLIILSATSFAHVEPLDETTLYNQAIYITSVTIIDDKNWFGPADLFFNTITQAHTPPHDTYVELTPTYKISSGETLVFNEPILAYNHDSCHCDQEFNFTVYAFDHTPLKNFAKKAVRKGISAAGATILGGLTGLIINTVGEIVDLITEAFQESGLSEEEAREKAFRNLLEESQELGVAHDDFATPCDLPDIEYEEKLLLKGKPNGSITYRIVKTPFEEEESGACVFVEEGDVSTAPDDEEEEPKEADPVPESPTPPPPPPATSPSACLSAVRGLVDWTTGTINPEVSLSGNNQIIWNGGYGGCNPQVIEDFTRDFNQYIPQFNAQCPNLGVIRGYYTPVDEYGCNLDFLFRY